MGPNSSMASTASQTSSLRFPDVEVSKRLSNRTRCSGGAIVPDSPIRKISFHARRRSMVLPSSCSARISSNGAALSNAWGS